MEAYERLRELRLKLGLKASEMAEKLSVRPSTYSMVENGHNAISPRMMSMLKLVFKVNEKWLRGGQGEMFTTVGVNPTGNFRGPGVYRPTDIVSRLLNKKSMTISDFAAQVGLPPQVVADGINKGKFTDDVIEKIYAIFPEARPVKLTPEQMEERIYLLEEELDRYKRIVDAITKGNYPN